MAENHKHVIYQIFNRTFGNSKKQNSYNGTIEDNGSGKFNDINDKALQSLKKFGITHAWYTGVIAHASLTDYSQNGIAPDHPSIVKGIAGSPYAIRDYYDVDPDLAVKVDQRMQEFESLIHRTHQNGLKAIIDFVPNHVSRQYKSKVHPQGVRDFGQDDDSSLSFSPSNNFYYIPNEDFTVPSEVAPPIAFDSPYTESPAKATGNDVFHSQPHINDWYETIKLNYGVDYLNGRVTHFDPIPSTWQKMYDILAYWTGKGIDGFRCDMAEMVPVEFWGWVIEKIKQLNPKIIFIAEIYNPGEYHNYLFTGKFDYLYDKVGLYNTLRPLMEGNGYASDITRIWQQESGNFSERMLRFLENHDEQRIASKFFAGNPWAAIPAITLCATMHSGPFMIYAGQELGVNPTQPEGFQGDDGRTSIFDYWAIDEFQAWCNHGKYTIQQLNPETKKLRGFYQNLNHFIQTNEAVNSGEFYDLQYFNMEGKSQNYDASRMYCYLRHSANQHLLFIYNFDQTQTFSTQIKIPPHAWSETLGLQNTGDYILKPVFPLLESYPQIHPEEITSSGVALTMQPNSVLVLEIVLKTAAS